MSPHSVTHRIFRIPITNYSLICKLQNRSNLSLSALENGLTSWILLTVVYGLFHYPQRDNTLLHKPMYHVTFWRNNEIFMQVILSDICARKAPFMGRRQSCVFIKEPLAEKHITSLQTVAKAELSTAATSTRARPLVGFLLCTPLMEKNNSKYCWAELSELRVSALDVLCSFIPPESCSYCYRGPSEGWWAVPLHNIPTRTSLTSTGWREVWASATEICICFSCSAAVPHCIEDVSFTPLTTQHGYSCKGQCIKWKARTMAETHCLCFPSLGVHEASRAWGTHTAQAH